MVIFCETCCQPHLANRLYFPRDSNIYNSHSHSFGKASAPGRGLLSPHNTWLQLGLASVPFKLFTLQVHTVDPEHGLWIGVGLMTRVIGAHNLGYRELWSQIDLVVPTSLFRIEGGSRNFCRRESVWSLHTD